MAKKKEQINQEIQHIPPQAIEIEKAVLGAIMIEPTSELTVIDRLKPEYFYKEAHQKIYKAILDLSNNHEPIDQLTVIEQLKKNGDLELVGGAAYINLLAASVGTAAHLEYHSTIIIEKFIRRRIIEIANKLQEKSYSQLEDLENIIEYAEKEIFDIALNNVSTTVKPISSIIKETIDRLEELSKRKTTLSGVPSGFTQLDRITSGWQPSDLIIIAARPSMGKTAFILTMALNVSLHYQIPVAIFSLEMSAQQLVTRMLVSESQIESNKIKSGKLNKEEWQKLEAVASELSKAPIFIDDTPSITLSHLRTKARNLKIQNNIQLIIVDYLQLMTGPQESKNSREQEVSQISRGLKAIAKELNIPVIALSQLNRAVESRKGFRPQLSDLRESGAIEQDADLVVFIHRPEKYMSAENIDESNKGLAEIIIAKHRNGPVTEINLKFIDHLAKFVDYSESPELLLPNEITFGSKMNLDSFDDFNDFNNQIPF